MKTNLLITTAFAILLAASPLFAQVNPNFDTNLSGWTTTGDASVRDGTAYLTTATSVGPGDDGVSNFNFSGTNIVDSLALETFAGLASGALDPDPANSVFAFEGSAIKQTFNVQAGDFIGFTWQLLTNEASGNDYAFVFLDGVFATLGTSASATPTSIYGFSRATNTGSFLSSTFTTAQTITLTVGIVDAGSDGATSSALRFDTVTIPEPSTYALLALSAVVGFFFLHRRNAQARK